MGQENQKSSRRASADRTSPNPLGTPTASTARQSGGGRRPGSGAPSRAGDGSAPRQRSSRTPPAAKGATEKQKGKNTAGTAGLGSRASDQGSRDDAEDMDEATLLAQQAATMAELEVQLAAANKILERHGMEDDGGPEVAVSSLGASAGKPVDNSVMVDPDKSIGDISLHSSDYADETLLQGLRDLDDELEEDHRKQVEELESRIADHKRNAVRLLKEVGDKPAAMKELQLAKELEGELAKLQLSHVPPVSIRMEAMEADIAKLEETVADRKQQALAALRAGEKPTALVLLKEAKELETQLDAKREAYAELAREKEALLHSSG